MGRYKFEIGQKVIVTKGKVWKGFLGVVTNRQQGYYLSGVRQGVKIRCWFDVSWLAAYDEPEFNGNI